MLKLIPLFCLFATLSFGQEGVIYLHDEIDFEIASEQMIFGDNVNFRSQPNTNSKVLDTLSIGSIVTIIKKSEETMVYGGVNWNWYKVNFKGVSGYVLGGLISVVNAEVDGDYYVSSYHEDKEDNRIFEYRFITEEGSFISGEAEIYTGAISIEAFDNRGLDGIDNMIYINFYAEACGVDGGGIYIFNDGENLIEAMHVTEVVDGAEFWFNESLTFPEDEKGEKNAVIYQREHGESQDEEMIWERVLTDIVYLKWEDGQFTPNVEELEFNK